MKRPPSRTGRTEIMLLEIAKLVKQDQPCFVIVSHPNHSQDICKRLIKMVGDKSKVHQCVTFTTPDCDKVDIKCGRVFGNNCNVFADHNVFEDRCWWLYNQWKKWNDGSH